MLVHAILFDSAMPVSAVLSRLARHGIWLDPKQPDAADWIRQQAELMELPFDEVAALIKEPNPNHYGAAIRRQWVANVLWYARPIAQVLDACSHANRDTRLIDALGLHEYESRPTQALNRTGNYTADSVVVQNDRPVAVNLPQANAAPAFQQLNRQRPAPAVAESVRSGAEPQAAGAEPPPTTVSVWPKMDAPTYARASVPFDLTVGFSLTQQQGVAGGKVNLTAAPGADRIDVSVELLAEGFDPPDGGWTRPLSVPVADPASASVTFRLVAKPPTGPEPVRLTTLEVRFVIGGKVCGTASRPIIVGPETGDKPAAPYDKGTPWLGEPPTATPMDMSPDADTADLTIELAKPDRNPTTGDFVCRLYSRHAIQTPMGPWDVHLGQDVKTFAQQLIKTVRQSSKVLVTKYLRSVGKLVTQTLPAEVFDAIAEVAAKTAPRPPAILFLSDEPFVPWELALLEVPIDKDRPPFLGAQTIFGRWFREPAAASTSRQAPPQKPPSNPPSGIAVKHMAAIAGNYTPKSGLAALPGAEAEVKKLKASLDAVPMRATPEAILQVLEARLEREMDLLGPAGAVHYAGHGQFDATDPDSSVLFLSDGTALSSLLFRDAEYGGEHQPIIFFNACMIGLGGEVLGDMGGFPGNCLRGGFGAVLGALWEVDDTVAGDIALEFWERTLPKSGPGEPVAEVLRDLRAKYSPQQPVPTYLAYTYWGHPRLRLQRLS